MKDRKHSEVENGNILIENLHSFTKALDILGADSLQTIVINEGSMNQLDDIILSGYPNCVSQKLLDTKSIIKKLEIDCYILNFVTKNKK